MKIYVHKGVEGQDGYVKQSMKLPKSWSSKPLKQVLELFVETYNKKHTPVLNAEEWHLERPLGSTLFPDDHVSAALTEYADVWCVAGAVKYKGPPPGTAAALEAKEAEERKRKEDEAALAEPQASGPDASQWNVQVKCIALDRGGMDVKSQWKENDVARVVIEPHATIGMLKNRVGLMVGAHPKHQTMKHPKNGALDDLDKLKDVMASDLVVLELIIKVPPVAKKIVEVLSDDEGWTGPETDEPPSQGSQGDDVELQSQLISQADAESSDLPGNALDLYTRAVQAASPSPSLLCKRGTVLLKLKRPTAAALDASAALDANPDSAKAYKLRAKAKRMLGDYDGASADFGQAQRIDFDDSIIDLQAYVSKRAAKIRANALAEAENAEHAEKSEEA